MLRINDLIKYYELLELKSDAEVEEIKRAYRSKALNLHPDRNPSADAHDQFIAITKAYETIIDFKNGKLRYSSINKPSKSPEEIRREELKKRAAAEARRKHEEYINSEEYKTADALEVIFSHVYFLFGILLMLVIITVLLYVLGAYAILVLIFGVIFGIKPLVKLIKEEDFVDVNRLFNAIKYLGQTSGFLMLIFTIINLVTLLSYAPKTLINYGYIATAYVIFIVPVYGVLRFSFEKFSLFLHVFIPCCVGPTLISVFLALNYNFSKNPQVIQYEFRREMVMNSNGHYEPGDYIVLDGNALPDFPHIRKIPYDNKSFFKKKVTYTFEEGLFGYRVMKSYTLENE